MAKPAHAGKAKASQAADRERARVAALIDGHQAQEAEAALRAMLQKNRGDIWAWFQLTLLQHESQRHAEALLSIQRALALAPGFAPGWQSQATVLQALGHNEQALKSFDEALRLEPASPYALLNSGVLLGELSRPQQALERFLRLLALQPTHKSALANCSVLLDQLGQQQAAVAMVERLLQQDPQHPYGLGLLSFGRLRACDWRDIEPLSQAIVAGVRAGQRVCRSFALMALPSTAADHLQAARIFAQHRIAPAPALWRGERYDRQHHQRLRIAYVSPDLREHPVSHLMRGIFQRHDRSRFETIAISIGANDGSAMRQQLERCFDHFIDLADQGPLQIAQRIRALEVDILIDLAGYTADGRPAIFAHRPAPIQVSYLGYPGTLGTAHMDVILADRHVIPPEHHAFYAERVAYLPDCYLPAPADIALPAATPSRADCGLPETGPVLCAFSHSYKLHPTLWSVWMRLLQQLPGSVLWLAVPDSAAQANLQREAQVRGVDPARLVFAPRLPRVEDHLARYRLADLFLDTSPYNAHTTAADALLAGLPVVTLQGDAFPARVAASLLHAIGLPELITTSAADYEALVLQLLRDAPRLLALRARLAANRATQPLFDTDRLCRNIEAAYLAMHAEHSGGSRALTPTLSRERERELGQSVTGLQHA
jgi:predicted O-linked N-acetylglucosamine transferase (SPINDLY family)